MDNIYEFIIKKYGYNQPLFLEELHEQLNMDEHVLIGFLNALSEQDKLLKISDDIFYIPRKISMLKKPTYDITKIIERKYIRQHDNETIGYIAEFNFANMLGLTTQTASIQTIATNKAEKKNDSIKLDKRIVMIKKPKIIINNKNYKILQCLDLLENYQNLSEFSLEKTINVIGDYLSDVKLEKDLFEQYILMYSPKTKEYIEESRFYSEITS